MIRLLTVVILVTFCAGNAPRLAPQPSSPVQRSGYSGDSGSDASSGGAVKPDHHWAGQGVWRLAPLAPADQSETEQTRSQERQRGGFRGLYQVRLA